MIEDTTILLFDLDVIAYVLPVEDGRLFLDDRRGFCLHLLEGVILPTDCFLVVCRLQVTWLLSTPEDENLALGLLGSDQFGGDKIGCGEADQKDD